MKTKYSPQLMQLLDQQNASHQRLMYANREMNLMQNMVMHQICADFNLHPGQILGWDSEHTESKAAFVRVTHIEVAQLPALNKSAVTGPNAFVHFFACDSDGFPINNIVCDMPLEAFLRNSLRG
jgi:hypothetical protein